MHIIKGNWVILSVTPSTHQKYHAVARIPHNIVAEQILSHEDSIVSLNDVNFSPLVVAVFMKTLQ